MPSRLPPKIDGLGSSGEVGHGQDIRRTRQQLPSRFARENPLSPRASQSLKFKDKVVKAENLIRPPYADLPLEFVKNANNGYLVQAKDSGARHQSDKVRKSACNEEELIKYMSKVPGYLQKGEKPQGSVLNFGVLDWGRLEQWTNKQSKNSDTCSTSNRGGSSMPSAAEKTGGFGCQKSHRNNPHSSSVHKVDFSPVVRPLKGMALNHPESGTSMDSVKRNNQESFRRDMLNVVDAVDLRSGEGMGTDKRSETCRKDKSQVREAADLQSEKGKEKYSNDDNTLLRARSSNLLNHDHKGLGSSNKKISSQGAEPQKSFDKFEGLEPHKTNYHCSGNQESIVLLQPKDFSRPCSSEVSPRASADGKSAQHNWGSFSDIFSVDEINPDEAFSDVPQSCPLKSAVETETELDTKLDNLVRSQGVELPVIPPDIPTELTENNVKAISSASITLKASNIARRSKSLFSAEMNRDRHQRVCSDVGKITRSLSFREGSVHPPPSSAHVTVMSGPAKPDGCSSSETSKNKADNNGRRRPSPLRRLIEPLLKSKVVNQMKEHPNELRMKPPIPVVVPEIEKCNQSINKALLHFTVKSGLPLFKFVVETTNEILASTVKSLGTFGQDDLSLLYTFYSVTKARKKIGGWKNQKVRPCAFDYNVVGQMKVCKPHMPSWCEQISTERYKVKGSVLYSVDVNNGNAETSEFKSTRELAAVVMNEPDETGKRDSTYSQLYQHEGISKDEKSGHTVVILPGGNHSLPQEGVPSSLINRWRSGGICDCGGWDEGCKLRILTELKQDLKVPINSSDVRCDLYDQGEAKQSKPFFRLVPVRDGLFSVVFDAKLSSLQAFSISVAVINGKNPTIASDTTDQFGSKVESGRATVCKGNSAEGHEIHAPHPPLSPVGRV